MEFSPEFWAALLSIVMIDLVLAGDNAIVIGLSARNLPKNQQKKVILWGTAGAILIRTALTLGVVWLLEIPGLLLAGGLLLIWIAYKLLVEGKKHDDVESGANVFAAIRTIVIADTVMGMDNVLAVAGAAEGSPGSEYVLVIFGLLLSVPIMIWGSTLILKWVERFPIIITIGAAVLAYTAGKMIAEEKLLEGVFAGNPLLKWTMIIVLVVGVVVVGEVKRRKGNLPSNAS